MPETTGQPPIPDPVVEIDGRKLTVVFDFYAEYKCSEAGCEIAGAKYTTYNMMQLWAACVASNYTGVETAPTAEQWVKRIGEDMPLRLRLWQAVGVAMENFTRRRIAAAAPPTQVETPAPSPAAVN